MARSKSIPTDEIVQLTVTLEGIEPPVWRRIEVPADMTLAGLHKTVQVALGWQGYHLHEFLIGRSVYGQPEPHFDVDREIKDERRRRLRTAGTGPGDRFTYVYDLGDSWEHTIAIEEFRPREPRIRYPRLIAGARSCPPEDVGGPDGYADFLEAITDPAHREHASMLEWVGYAFNPETFDVEAVNEAFATSAGFR